jgi:hypothetical protein
MLATFQDNLGGISSEIRSLQEQSLSLSVQVANRKALDRKLAAFLSKVSVPEALITRVVEGAIDEAWMRELDALAEKLAYAQRGAAGGGEPAAAAAGGDSADADGIADLTVNPFTTPVGRESMPQVEKLRAAACARLRGFLAKVMGELTMPKQNMAVLQQHVLLKYAPGMTFLNAYGGETGREVRGLYCDAVGRYYADIFKKYLDELRAGALAPGAAKGDTLVEYNAQARLAAAVAVSAPLPLAALSGTGRALCAPIPTPRAPPPLRTPPPRRPTRRSHRWRRARA